MKRTRTRSADKTIAKKSATTCKEEEEDVVVEQDSHVSASTSTTTTPTSDKTSNASASHQQPDTPDELECAICMEIYKQPKLLECMHTFCGGCIDKMMTHNGQQQDSVVCPTCRFETKVGENKWRLLQNYVMEQKVKSHNVSLKQENSSFNCSECEAEAAVNLCTDCPALKLCESCTVHHKKCVRSKDHSIQSIQSASNEQLCNDVLRCAQHKLDVNLYCETCQVGACSGCVTSGLHARHDFVALDNEILNREYFELSDKLDSSDDVLVRYEYYVENLEGFDRNAADELEASKEVVEKAFEEIIAILLKNKRELLDWLEAPRQSSADALKSTREKLSHMKKMSSYLKEVLKYPKEKTFDFVHNGMSQWCKKLTPIEKTTKMNSLLGSIDHPPCSDTEILDSILKLQEKADSEIQISSRIIGQDRFQLLEVRDLLKKVGSLKQIVEDITPPSPIRSVFNLEESIFPSPVGVLRFKVGNLSGCNWKKKFSTLVQIGNFFWSITVSKHKRQPFGKENDESSWGLDCSSAAADYSDMPEIPWSCRIRLRMFLKNPDSGETQSICCGPFLLTHETEPNWRLCRQNISWDDVLKKGFVKNDQMEVFAVVKIEKSTPLVRL